MANPFGTLGTWITRRVPSEEIVAAARRAEELGYGTVWIGGGGEPGVFDLVGAALEATSTITVATGIVNIWVETPQTVTDAWHRLETAHPGRLYVGVGISHARIVEGMNLDYKHPLATVERFLDGLDQQPDAVPHDRLLLAALGPKMLKLAADRTLGTHPYLATVENTAAARAGVGDAIVAPELGVVLEPSLEKAREIAREHLAYYVGLPNYSNNWKRSGFTDEDLRDGGSDRLVDALVALGDVDAIAARVQAHRDAGADHVCLQALGSGGRLDVIEALAGLA